MVQNVLAWLVAGVVLLAGVPVVAAPPHGGPAAPAEGQGDRGMRPAPDRPHIVRGEVMSVNEARGALTLKTADGDVDLRLPAGAVKGIKKGDRVAVQLVVKRAGTTGGKAAAPHATAPTAVPGR
ncbi:MAG TPA: hypothetical protein VGX21_06185 [Methylomirabilota bacterium]|nr:hypothetical protein [Methylomirabilota bacterium]